MCGISICLAQVCCGQLTGDIPLPEEQRIYRDMNPSNPEMKLLYVTPEKVYTYAYGTYVDLVHCYALSSVADSQCCTMHFDIIVHAKGTPCVNPAGRLFSVDRKFSVGCGVSMASFKF